jgi:pimeloyl-ACP methyl ester carboxylesterase
MELGPDSVYWPKCDTRSSAKIIVMKRKVTLLLVPLALLATTVTVAGIASADEIGWKACGSQSAECATFEVPRDWDEPDGDTVTLSMARLPAAQPDARIGTLFFNPGGPGTGAAGYVSGYAEQTFSAQLRDHFDIIGIDPRGVVGSEQITCDVPVYDPAVTMYPHSRREYRKMVSHNTAVGDSCDDLIADVDTASVARDFDAVRAALGESQLSFFGQSYGTMLGTAYAEMFPDHVRTMALDAVVDHSLSSEQLVLDGAKAVEKSFNAFARWCDGATDCALHGQDVGTVWDEVVDKAGREPLPVEGGSALTAEELLNSGYAMLNLAPDFSADFAAAIATAAEGDGSGFAPIRDEARGDPARSAAYRSILCMDIAPQLHGYSPLQDRLSAAEEVAPHMQGTSEFWDMTAGCLNWPVEPTNPQHPIDITHAPPVLLVGNTMDPATPLSWARSLSQSIRGSGVLSYDGQGHTAYHRSACATKHINEYLVSGQLPDADTVCTS